MITLFSSPKSFTDEHIARIQRNAIRSWLALGDDVEVLLIGDEPGLAQVAEELNVPLLAVRSRAPSGAPLINELFDIAHKSANHSILGYINADIILLDDFIPSVEAATAEFRQFLVVGNRYDVEIHEHLNFQEDWIGSVRSRLKQTARLHKPMGSDYFIYHKEQFEDMPAFALGRAGWDNWMMYKARFEGWPLIDASASITVVHQDHDYAHLPGGEPHYRHPESRHNIELAGGYEAMFRLRDANLVMSSEGIRRKNSTEWEWPRKIEADLISRFGTGFRARLTRMVFHPGDALSYVKHRLFVRRYGQSARSGNGIDLI